MTMAIMSAVQALEVRYTRIETHTDITIGQERELTPLTLKVLKRIADSPLLSLEEKRALIRLTAFVDEFAGGNPKLLRDIAGLARLMEMNNAAHKRMYAKMPLAEAIARYFAEREKMGGDDATHISVDTLFEEVVIEFIGMTQVEATKALSPDSAVPVDPAPV